MGRHRNISYSGKYVADHDCDPDAVDEQPGCVAMTLRIVQLRPDLGLPVQGPAPAPDPTAPPPPIPPPPGLQDATALQTALNQLGLQPPLVVDGSYGFQTRLSVEAFQQAVGITVDGLAGPETWAAINAELGVTS